jgi:uncharacterized protein YlxW (UPF0749 family)
MTDEETRDLFHRLELRLERLDTRVDQLEKRLSDGFSVVHGRFEGLENRLARKADTWVVTVGIGGLGLLLTIDKFFV